MSGLYNMVFGYNELAGPLLSAIQLAPGEVPRFRDCFLTKDGTEIVVYTRTGGGNREEYADRTPRWHAAQATCVTRMTRSNSTYALFFFAVPEMFKEPCLKAAAAGMGVDPAERWNDALAALRSNT